VAESTDQEVVQWLKENNFDSSVIHQLQGYSGGDLYSMSKEDAKSIIGVKDGIRLYNRIKCIKDKLQAEIDSKAAQDSTYKNNGLQIPINMSSPLVQKMKSQLSSAQQSNEGQFQSTCSGSSASSTMNVNGIRNGNQDNTITCTNGNGNSSDPLESRKSPLVKSPASKRKPCEIQDCSRPSIVVCESEFCQLELCHEHSTKDLITSYSYCPKCSSEFAWSNNKYVDKLHEVFCKVQ
jgi:hypothetical protein